MSESQPDSHAPGHPGIAPTWCSSAKDAVTSSLGQSRVWATIGRGILNEIYWPSTGRPQVRDLGFLVTWPGGWCEVKRHDRYTIEMPQPFAPVPTITHESEHFRLDLEVVCDDVRDCVLIRYKLAGDGVRLYVLLAPRMGMQGMDNTAWVDGDLHATNEGHALCLASSCGFSRGSAGFVGESDGWQDFDRHGRMTWEWTRAEHGNVALFGELQENDGVLALGLAETPQGATTLARTACGCDFDETRDRVVRSWQEWSAETPCAGLSEELHRHSCLSAAVLKVCEDRTYPGAVVASLSVPWGNSRDDLGGYHLVWARDCVESGFAMLAIGQDGEARRMLAYLAATQQEDGHWKQNFYPDGTPYWTGVQLDEAGFPILLAAKLKEVDCLDGLTSVGAMVRRAAGFLVRQGPVTDQDRWEETAGISPFTLAVQIASLVASAEFLADENERELALSFADYLNERAEDWTYAKDTPLAQDHGVAGHYVRIAPPSRLWGDWGSVLISNTRGHTVPAESVVGLDFLYLARLGLRSPSTPEMADSLEVAEAVLGVDTPSGRCYYRYNGDGYGEHEDGSPFDSSGHGRPWPLLTGERAHFALLAGEDVMPYLQSLVQMTGRAGLMPEQIWDAEPIPERLLEPGKPTGSAMPLLWAHAEYLKLAHAARERRPIELLQSVERRYASEKPQADTWHWREDMPFEQLPTGRSVLIERREPFTVRFGYDDWKDIEERDAQAIGFGLFGVRIEAGELRNRGRLDFTWRVGEQWSRQDLTIALG